MWAVESDPSHGSVTMSSDGTYTYTPDANFNGTDTFTYTVEDDDGDVSTATVTVTVNPVDDVPLAVDDTTSTDEDTAVTGSAQSNDTPSGDGGNVWAVESDPSHGSVTMSSDGTYTYTPDANFNGTDTFTYTVEDDDGDVSTATVTVTVNPVDDVPLAVDDTTSTDEDTAVTGSAQSNDTPSGDGGNVWAVESDPSHGSVTMSSDGTYTYTPDANFNGTDTFTYTVEDDDGDVSTATVTVTVNPVDDVPLAVDDTTSTDEDTAVTGSAQSNDTPSGDGGNVWAVESDPSHGSVTMSSDGTYTYTPDANFNGTDTFTYTVEDDDGDVSTATVTVTVNPVDDVPLAVDDTTSTDEDTAVTGSAQSNDTPSGDGGNVWAVESDPSHGSVTMSSDGTYTYTPDANFNGTDTFTYTVEDDDGDVSTATVTVTVNPVDDVPLAVDDTTSTDEDTR
ncbi:cadherin-like domain-containing protein [Prosthecochloris sp. SCSIO W1101]|uniref:tandem-95 repeat protein n=1 Tax=Prosthecochloris sp. SCSIO W1101 TaxID=2992242 RepID=UPI00223D5671|nr:Ig-like domain-containing protein [Prosthecochloris sp. SCSIO W1101]UZJ42244.1 cadherin-like domain-containing protein [Prosthecochloris sp. SCSIO W1101]